MQPNVLNTAGIRLATSADTPRLVKMLARTFYDDPFAMWVCPPDNIRMRHLESFYAPFIKMMLHHETMWTTQHCEGVAIWAPPGKWRHSLKEMLPLSRSLLFPQLLLRAPLVATGLALSERAHPETPEHYYLAMLGTDPESQGRGLGSAMLKPMLDQCDDDGIPAYLESSKHANVAFYARHGFRVVREFDVLRGPRIYLMWREPR